MAASNYDKFRALLAEMFMFDQADLDFGIYRIMNAKRDEILRFLDKDLLPQVRETLGTLESGERVQIKAELDKVVEATKLAGIDPEQSPRVRELQTQYDATADVGAIEKEVFSELANFFRRYYREGDFLSLRRYKKDVYALPYEGEEVKLHWANADQYYIKSSEYFRDYTFKLPDERRVHFKLVAADTEQNNNKSAADKERRFILCDDEPLREENGELVICFEYRADPEKRKREKLNADAADRILSTAGYDAWTGALGTRVPTASNPKRTLLDKHLN
ncbi:MAG: site-specific DNA-methyltransferase, partial [Chloroflexi bacterium]